jgi:glyceraldehyde 3-phosphate dehydrogenase
MIRVALNGFGRTARAFFRIAHKDPQIEVVAINVRSQTPEQAAYLCKYDSVYGRFDGTVSFGEDLITVNGKKIRILQIEDPVKLSWGELKIDVTVEATGLFRDAQKAGKHLQAGAKKVLITAPAKGDIPTIVWGVNEKIYDRAKHHIVSAASCTTNCLAPVAYILHKEFGIIKGLMTTVHAYTASQNLVDGSNKEMVEGRAATINIIPTTTGAASAIGLVIPELNGKLDGMALRVPVATGSVTDLVAEVERSVTVEQINETFTRYANGPIKQILAVSQWPLVSSDCIGDSHSAIVDLSSTKVIEKSLVKVVAFYDNEWGYSARLVDLVRYL